MFKIASLYGIGLHPNVNRTPGLNEPIYCLRQYIREFSMTFPNVIKLIKFDDLKNKKVAEVKFETRTYGNLEIIHDIPNKYLVVNGGYFQRFRYFSHIMDEIRQLFDFHPKIKSEVEQYGTQLFKFDKFSYKMCIHIKEKNFIEDRLLQTKTEFLIPAIATVRNFILQKYSKIHISLVFFTDDEKFVNSFNFSKEYYSDFYRPKLTSRGAAMYFGVRYCDSLLISAGESSFASWIGLLMPTGKDIFYNRRGSNNVAEDVGEDHVDYERYPKHWNSLELIESNNTVVINNR